MKTGANWTVNYCIRPARQNVHCVDMHSCECQHKTTWMAHSHIQVQHAAQLQDTSLQVLELCIHHLAVLLLLPARLVTAEWLTVIKDNCVTLRHAHLQEQQQSSSSSRRKTSHIVGILQAGTGAQAKKLTLASWPSA